MLTPNYPYLVLVWARGRVLDAYGPFDSIQEAEDWINEVLDDPKLGSIVNCIPK